MRIAASAAAFAIGARSTIANGATKRSIAATLATAYTPIEAAAAATYATLATAYTPIKRAAAATYYPTFTATDATAIAAM